MTELDSARERNNKMYKNKVKCERQREKKKGDVVFKCVGRKKAPVISQQQLMISAMKHDNHQTQFRLCIPERETERRSGIEILFQTCV